MNLLIDLFAGLGGASQAFVRDPNWDVIQLDNNPALIEHNPDLIMLDLSNLYNIQSFLEPRLSEKAYDKIVLWASPPCLEFSLGYNAPGPTAQRENRKFEPDLNLMLNSKWIADLIQDWIAPRCEFTWVIENVRGAIPHFTPHLGKYNQSIGAFFLWGNFATLQVDDATLRHVKPDARHSPIRSNVRAKVPAGLSLALKNSVEKQQRITSYR